MENDEEAEVFVDEEGDDKEEEDEEKLKVYKEEKCHTGPMRKSRCWRRKIKILIRKRRRRRKRKQEKIDEKVWKKEEEENRFRVEKIKKKRREDEKKIDSTSQIPGVLVIISLLMLLKLFTIHFKSVVDIIMII